jgi:hypothetical protein
MSVLSGAIGCKALATRAPVIARLDRAIQYAEAVLVEPRGRGVLDAPVKPGHDSGECGDASPNLAQLFHFATLFPVPLSFGTTLERIAAESQTPLGVLFRSRKVSWDSFCVCTRWSFGVPHKPRFDDGFG